MAPNFPIDKSYLIASWCAASLWGAFTVIFVFCMVSILTRMDRPRTSLIIGGVVIMYVLASVHVSLTLARNLAAFIEHVNDIGPALYLANIGHPLNRSKDMIYITTIVLADAVLLWRCFVIWNKNYYVAALPAIMIMGTAISGYGAVGRFFLAEPDVTLSVHWAEAMLAVSLTTNIILTILTAGRIWKLSREIGGISFSSSQARYNHVVLLIVESGVIMAISKAIELILFVLAPSNGIGGLNALYIVMDCMPQIMGICPTFIILAVNRGFTTTDPEAYTSSSGYDQRRNFQGQKKAVELSMPFIVAASESHISNQTGTTASVPNELLTGDRKPHDPITE